MAVLCLENGTKITELRAISTHLAPLNIKLDKWPVGNNPELLNLLAKPSLTEEEKEQVLHNLDNYFLKLQKDLGYQARDLIVIHPDSPNLDTMLAKFTACHTHADDEVRYIVEGEGVFGFVLPDASQVEVIIEAQEYVNVPAGTEHWFHLTPSRRVKAVRYFTNTVGWVPEYTSTTIRFAPISV